MPTKETDEVLFDFDLDKMGMMILLFPSGTDVDDVLDPRDPRITQLFKLCPAKFKMGNIWMKYVNHLLTAKSHPKNFGHDWKWKSDDEETQSNQYHCLRQLLRCDLYVEILTSVACWMLSEMLIEPPKVSTENFDWEHHESV